jgi:hypothetical protein
MDKNLKIILTSVLTLSFISFTSACLGGFWNATAGQVVGLFILSGGLFAFTMAAVDILKKE